MKQGIQTNFPHDELKAYGCYFFVLLRWAEILDGGEFTESSILQTFEQCKKAGWIEKDCFIVNPVAILNYCQNKKAFKAVSLSSDQPKEDVFVVYNKKPGHGHFTLGTKDGAVWDSLDPSRPGVKDYRVESYRVLS